MKIYTKTGDSGETGLVGGSRLSKSDLRVEAIGDVDELNAVLGLVISGELPDEIAHHCRSIQHALFNVGALVATPGGQDSHVEINHSQIAALESTIDFMEERLEPLRQFILPGGCNQAALLHLARTIARRAERSIIRLSEQGVQLHDRILIYMNRLSDFLFVAARYVNLASGEIEQPWENGNSPNESADD